MLQGNVYVGKQTISLEIFDIQKFMSKIKKLPQILQILIQS
jgi:hypothetical protein